MSEANTLTAGAGTRPGFASRLMTFGYAMLVGWRDARSIYTWRTWVGGWLLRVCAQVTFFALVGLLIGSREQMYYLFVGHSVLLAAMGAIFAVATTTWERRMGTLPLLVAAPVSPTLVFVGRSLENAVDGVLSAWLAFAIVAGLLGFPVRPSQALILLPLLTLIGLSTVMLGLALGALVLRAMESRNLVGNVGYMLIMTIAGVNVPVDFWPSGVQRVAAVLPLTHGLAAARLLLDGAGLAEVAAHAGWEALVGCGWLAVAIILFRHFVEQGRRSGTIEFGE